MSWLSDKVIKDACLKKYKRFREGLGPTPKSPGAGQALVKPAPATWAGDQGDDETDDSCSSSDSGDEGMKDKISDLKAQLKKAEREARLGKEAKKAQRSGKEIHASGSKPKKKRHKRDDPEKSGEEDQEERS